MFRRPSKNPLEEHASMFEEEPHSSSPYKYASPKEEPPPRIFDTPQQGGAHQPRLQQRPHENPEEPWRVSSTQPPSLPHHFVQDEDPETTLGEGVSFRGELSFERLLRIDGTFEGELLSQGKVVVGPKGRVKANLTLREAIIEGTVEGNIIVQEKLELRGEARVKGDIQAKSLCVDEGVSIVGHINIMPDAHNENSV